MQNINWYESFRPIYQILGIIIFLLFIILIVALLIKKIKNQKHIKLGKEWRSDQEVLNELRGYSPKDFELFITQLFSNLGFKTEQTGGSYDGGIDVIATKDGIKHYIQCKKFITRQVSVHDIRDFYGALANKLANAKGYFITTNKFTLEAIKFAEDKPIELIDGFQLIKYIKLANKDISARVNINESENLTCPECGNNLTKKKGKFGYFIGCSNYPNCKYSRKI